MHTFKDGSIIDQHKSRHWSKNKLVAELEIELVTAMMHRNICRNESGKQGGSEMKISPVDVNNATL